MNEECYEMTKKNGKALKLTRLFKNWEICDICWPSSINKIEKFTELHEAFHYLSNKIYKGMMFPADNMCNQGCV